MGIIPYTEEEVGDGVLIVTWANLALNDVGVAYGLAAQYPIKTIELTGNLGPGGECTIEGSNLKFSINNPPVIFNTLSENPSGAPLVMLGIALKWVAENPTQLRPNITNGDATTKLTVRMTMTK